MSETTPSLDRPDETQPVYRFVVAGISLRKAFRTLKPAFPKRKDISSTRVVISASSDKVTFALTGAEMSMAAAVDTPFCAEIPFAEFMQISADAIEDGQLINFEFSQGSIKVLGVTSKSPQIRVRSAAGDAENPTEPAEPVILNPMDIPIGLPHLLGVYAYIRRFGKHGAADLDFMRRQEELENILKRAEKVLEPLGLSRSEIESMLDHKIGRRP